MTKAYTTSVSPLATFWYVSIITFLITKHDHSALEELLLYRKNKKQNMPLPIIAKNYYRDFSSLLTSLLMPNTFGILGIPKQTFRLVYLQCIAWKGICIWSYWHQQQRIGNATIIIIKKIQFFVAVYCCVCPYKYHSCVTVVWTMNITTEVLWLSRTINNFTVNYTNLIQTWRNIFNTARQKLALQFYTFFTLKRQRAHIVLLHRIFFSWKWSSVHHWLKFRILFNEL